MNESATPTAPTSNGTSEGELRQLNERVGRLEGMMQEVLDLLRQRPAEGSVPLAALRKVEQERDGYLQSLYHLTREEFPLSDEELDQLTPGGPTLEDIVRELDAQFGERR